MYIIPEQEITFNFSSVNEIPPVPIDINMQTPPTLKIEDLIKPEHNSYHVGILYIIFALIFVVVIILGLKKYKALGTNWTFSRQRDPPPRFDIARIDLANSSFENIPKPN